MVLHIDHCAERKNCCQICFLQCQQDKTSCGWEATFSEAFFVVSEGVDAVVCGDAVAHGCINAISLPPFPFEMVNKGVFNIMVCHYIA